MALPELIHIGYSPWSERARWALRHHQVEHTRKHYKSMVDEMPLRFRLGSPLVPVSVPVMFAEGGVLRDSFAIACYAERHGKGEPLMSPGMDAMRHYHDHAQRLLEPARMCVTLRTQRSSEALKEALPKPFGNFGPLSLVMAGLGVRMLVSKYGLGDHDEERLRALMREQLQALRADLDGRDYLFDTFSYADIAMACALQLVHPVDERYIRLGPHTRRCWSDPVLADDYADLMEWRDSLYTRHRRSGAKKA